MAADTCFHEIVDSKMSGFLTGAGGTGKSTLVRKIVKTLREKSFRIAVTACTGVAAVQLGIKGATTVHSFFRIGLGKDPVDTWVARTRSTQRTALQRLNVWIVDEISMLDGDLLDKLDDYLRQMRPRSATKPFGGIQVIFVGDFYQLPPIDGKFAFESNVWKEAMTMEEKPFKVWELTEVHRQISDPVFTELLLRARKGHLTSADVELLQSRVAVKAPDDGIVPTKLFSRRDEVDRINATQLAAIESEPIRYNAFFGEIVKTHAYKVRRAADTDTKSFSVTHQLDLKVGAQVMLLCNVDVSLGLVNGSRGVVESFKDDEDSGDLETEINAAMQRRAMKNSDAIDDIDAEEALGMDSRYVYKGAKKLPVVRFTNGKQLVVPYASWSTSVVSGGTRTPAPSKSKRSFSLFDHDDEAPPISSSSAMSTTIEGPKTVVLWQMPLQLAWAQTIHKSQGCTLDRAELSLGSRVFAAGQAYVALSRVRSLDGLYLSEFLASSVRAHEKVRTTFESAFDDDDGDY
jgi:ATP-dependent DNA helicase PIF1